MVTLADTLGTLLLCLVVATGLGWPLAARLALPAPERLLAAVVLSLLGTFLFGWAVYVGGWSWRTGWILPAASVAGFLIRPAAARECWRDPDVRDLLAGQALVTMVSVALLALVVTYSGGGWVADWFGHWQRTAYFLDRGPRDILFNGFDPLTSRPPLANIVVGVLLALTRPDFAHYQLVTTMLASLAFLPAAVLARRFQGERQTRGWNAVAVLTALVVANPMFAQNATFAWTKLPAAFLTLAAIHFFLRSTRDGSGAATPLFAASLAAALLTHYSAGPYAVVLAAAWIIAGRRSWATRAWWHRTALGAAVGAAILSVWFGWSIATYGLKGTFLTNTSVTDQAASWSEQLKVAVLNVRDTLVPHFLRSVDYGFVAQASPWGAWRDRFFLLYQVNLAFMSGCVGWLVVLVLGRRRILQVPRATAAAWSAAVGITVALGAMVHAARDVWGLGHICLQPIVLLGLAFVAAHVDELGRGWRWLLAAGAAVDVVLGIALHFGCQSLLLDQWLAPQRPAAETLASYSAFAQVNLRAKLQSHWTFFGDSWLEHGTLLCVLVAALLLWAALRARARPRAE